MIFQHLETISEKGRIIVVGRTKSNESVAVVLDDVKPFLILENLSGLEESIEKTMKEIKFKKKIERMNKKFFDYKPSLNAFDENSNVTFDYLKGQDIIDYLENDKKTFLKVNVTNIYDYYTVKSIAKGRVYDSVKHIT